MEKFCEKLNDLQNFANFKRSLVPFDSWTYFYQSENQSSPIKCNNCKPNVTQQECFVLRSSFIDIKEGAIQYSTDDIKVLHSKCNFNNNTNAYNGGSVNFSCSSSFVQYKVCSLSSQVTDVRYKGGHHSYSDCKAADKLNFIYDSTISLCGNEIRWRTLDVINGNISIQSTNISKCTATLSSGYSFSAAKNDSVLFSTIENTTCNPEYIVIGYSDTLQNLVSFCNILNNYQFGSSASLIYYIWWTVIENCSILGNDGAPEFKLFGGYDELIFETKIRNCYIQSNGLIDKSKCENVIYEEKYLNLSHLSTSKCEASIPLVNDVDENISEEENNTLLGVYSKFLTTLFVPLSSLNKTS